MRFASSMLSLRIGRVALFFVITSIFWGIAGAQEPMSRHKQVQQLWVEYGIPSQTPLRRIEILQRISFYTELDVTTYSLKMLRSTVNVDNETDKRTVRELIETIGTPRLPSSSLALNTLEKMVKPSYWNYLKISEAAEFEQSELRLYLASASINQLALLGKPERYLRAYHSIDENAREEQQPLLMTFSISLPNLYASVKNQYFAHSLQQVLENSREDNRENAVKQHNHLVNGTFHTITTSSETLRLLKGFAEIQCRANQSIFPTITPTSFPFLYTFKGHLLTKQWLADNGVVFQKTLDSILATEAQVTEKIDSFGTPTIEVIDEHGEHRHRDLSFEQIFSLFPLVRISIPIHEKTVESEAASTENNHLIAYWSSNRLFYEPLSLANIKAEDFDFSSLQ